MRPSVDTVCLACSECLSQAFAAIERGEFSHRIEPCGEGANRDLFSAFNRMAERLEVSMAKELQALAGTRAALERERLVTEAVGLGSWWFDLRANRVRVEPYAQHPDEAAQGYEQDAEAFNARVHPDDLAALLSNIADYVERGISRYEAEFRLRHHDGSWRWVASFGRVVERDDEGRPLVLAGAYRDVTEIHKARAEIEAQQAFIATLSGNVPGLLHRLRVGNDGTLSFGFVGRNAQEIVGIEAALFTPERFIELLTPETREATVTTLLSVLASESRGEVEYEVRLPDGRLRTMRCVADLVARDADGADWNGILFDITHEVEQRRELERARRAAEAANDAKSAFLASMSHELRTPLTGILGYAQLIELRGKDPAARPLAATIRTSAERMRELLNDVLDTAKIEAGAMAVDIAPMRLDAVVFEVAELFRPAVAGKGLAFVVDTSTAGEILVAGDAQRARQVLLNLLSNAVKFTQQGRIAVGLRADDASVRVTVADTGPGVPAGFLTGIFERFRQADADVSRQHGGTGLGLALSRDFARLMGGDLVLRDGDGPGATFEFSLPRLAQAVAA